MTQVAPGGHRATPDPREGLPAGDFKVDSIDLYLTSVCNRRCTYCFLSDEFLNSKTRMSVDMVRSIVAWAAMSGTIREITLLGGEPALHPQFREVIDLIAAAGLSARTVTNGSRRFRDVLARLAPESGLGRVAVSLDATDPVQFDKMRGPRAYADVMATIDLLRERERAFEINFTVLKSTVDDVDRMINFAESLGATRLNMHWFSLVGRAKQHAADEVVPAREWRERVLEPVRKYRASRSDFVVDCELGYAYDLPGEDVSSCATRSLTNLQFFPSGAVFSCGMLVGEEERSGYLWRDGVLVARKGGSELVDTKKECHGCPLRNPDDGLIPLCIYNRLEV
jgi:MoaA/NifB/PqqE/SkfB family radical SAM enzyme